MQNETDRMCKLLRMIDDDFAGCEKLSDYFYRLAWDRLYEHEIRIFAPIRNLFSRRDWDTVEECQEAYELGFSAILADGELLGFKKDRPVLAHRTEEWRS